MYHRPASVFLYAITQLFLIFFSHLKFYKFQILFFSILIFQVRNNRKRLCREVLPQSMESLEAATGGLLQKSCSERYRKIHKKHLCQSLFFNKVAGVNQLNLF